MLDKCTVDITAAVYNNIALYHGLWTAKTASEYFCPYRQCQFSYVGIAWKMTACNLALSRSTIAQLHIPSLMFRKINYFCALFIMSNIRYTRKIYFRRLLWAVLTLNVVISRFLYIPFATFPPHRMNSLLNAYQLHTTSFESHKVLVKCKQMLQLAKYYLTAHIFRVTPNGGKTTN
jgi:hypothetical protein